MKIFGIEVGSAVKTLIVKELFFKDDKEDAANKAKLRKYVKQVENDPEYITAIERRADDEREKYSLYKKESKGFSNWWPVLIITGIFECIFKIAYKIVIFALFLVGIALMMMFMLWIGIEIVDWGLRTLVGN